jgi:SAM-dependent methyltransferase
MTEDSYVFQRSSEAERLRQQGRLAENMTRPLLEKIGLRLGMSCLDIGCGPGEAMRLMGEMVGDTGTVVGVDIDGTAGRSGIDRLRGEIECNFQFIEQDLSGSNPLPQGPFDLVFGRLVLIHLPDPIAMLRKMYAVTKPEALFLFRIMLGLVSTSNLALRIGISFKKCGSAPLPKRRDGISPLVRSCPSTLLPQESDRRTICRQLLISAGSKIAATGF